MKRPATLRPKNSCVWTILCKPGAQALGPRPAQPATASAATEAKARNHAAIVSEQTMAGSVESLVKTGQTMVLSGRRPGCAMLVACRPMQPLGPLPMKLSFLLAILLCLGALGALPALAQTPAPAWSADLNEIRHIAAVIPGA